MCAMLQDYRTDTHVMCTLLQNFIGQIFISCVACYRTLQDIFISCVQCYNTLQDRYLYHVCNVTILYRKDIHVMYMMLQYFRDRYSCHVYNVTILYTTCLCHLCNITILYRTDDYIMCTVLQCFIGQMFIPCVLVSCAGRCVRVWLYCPSDYLSAIHHCPGANDPFNMTEIKQIH